jgi:hypothetical protein
VKRFREIGTLFKYAWKNDHIETNPFERVSLDRPKRAIAVKRPEWTLDQLWVWFSSPVFTERYRPVHGEIAYWAVPLGMFHGLRLSEIAQLDRTDLVQSDGIWCLLVRPSEDDEDEQGKSAKTDTSVRTVPLHRRVVSDFLEYPSTLSGTKLFPGVRPDSKGRWSGRVSDWFTKYRRKLGLRERWFDFHALRHSWATAARGAYLDRSVHHALSGQEDRRCWRFVWEPSYSGPEGRSGSGRLRRDDPEVEAGLTAAMSADIPRRWRTHCRSERIHLLRIPEHEQVEIPPTAGCADYGPLVDRFHVAVVHAKRPERRQCTVTASTNDGERATGPSRGRPTR